ncbi:IS701 family transposase [Streptomyces sp. NBC_00233]|uniref:IS701 family transposase n=1 Tax=Streptomyces sp. NBC_00233 TaxID=2975686 RepID=UPI002252D0A9|nr:IS701 family transposase [Streptomyces sp. NBC_00233]MCX5231498.1 IS701 family transposase [Streptomyces sp. NBC_00233]MCX5233172.1 IS701 family transposase [Streptomyces sp. NBC_00233]MCX5233613.1 IS701 family transposase [Streptomyces sp. NBC_00233]
METLRDVERWAEWFEDFFATLAGLFGRKDLRGNAHAYLKALLAPVERKNTWQIAAYMGHVTPDRVKNLLRRTSWSWSGLRDRVRAFVVEHLGDPEAVLVLDETAFLKKGVKSVGVARQYAGITGQTENCQVAVFAAYVTVAGRALIDFSLYLGKTWAGDKERCRQAGVPRERAGAVVTKPELGRRLVERTRCAGVPFAWVAADSLYGQDRKLRAALQRHGKGYVMAVPCDETAEAGPLGPMRVGQLARRLPLVFERRSCGAGAKGERYYDWALAEVTWPSPAGQDRKGWQHLLLVRRSVSDPNDLAYFAVHARCGTTLLTLVQVAGMRWGVEDCFETAKSDCGLDQYEVRHWEPWHRHIALAIAAFAFLSVTATRTARLKQSQEPTGPDEHDDPAITWPSLAIPALPCS